MGHVEIYIYIYIYIYLKNKNSFFSSFHSCTHGRPRRGNGADRLEERNDGFLARKTAGKLGEHPVSLSPLALRFISVYFELKLQREFDLTLAQTLMELNGTNFNAMWDARGSRKCIYAE